MRYDIMRIYCHGYRKLLTADTRSKRITIRQHLERTHTSNVQNCIILHFGIIY